LGTIARFIRALADFEELSAAVSFDEELLGRHLFGARPYAEVLLAEERPQGSDSVVSAGFALFFHNFSTFLGRPGIFLEDLFVDPALRGRGHGKALLASLAHLALERGCGRVEWNVLTWNQAAIDFYQSLGARPLDDWRTYRMSGPALEALSRAHAPTA
jgi:GNAT superfamily N-acetyltransferase